VPLLAFCDVIAYHFKLKERHHICSHELCRDWAACKRGKFFHAESYTLFNLNNAYVFVRAFSFDRQHIMGAVPIYADVEFIAFYSAHSRNRGAEVTLK